MEKLYRFLKVLIAVLLVAVAAAAWFVFSGKSGQEPVETPPAAETAADTAPDFTMYDIDGNAVKLSDFRGKPVILNFWASWCGPCKSEMPDLEKAWQAHGQEVEFLIVNLTDGSSETVETASAYIGSQGYSFPVYYDVNMEGAAAYGIYAIPMTYFIDGEGTVRAIQEGMIQAEVLESNIRALLAL